MKDQEKLLLIKKTIQEEANRDVEEIMTEVKALEDNALSTVKEETRKEMELKMEQELSLLTSQVSTEISEMTKKRNQMLIHQRDVYVENIFDECKKRLIEFTKTSEYKDYLHKKLEALHLDRLSDPVIYVREEDKDLFDRDVQTGDIEIGGFIVEDKVNHLVFNETLEFALESQKSWFIQNSGLIIGG